MDYCNKCGGDPDEVGELTEWRTMNVCKSCLVNEPDYALFLEEVNEDLRAEVERLTAERDALARLLNALTVLSADPDDIENPSMIAFLESWTPMDLGANVFAYLSRTADALEKAGLMEVGNV